MTTVGARIGGFAFFLLVLFPCGRLIADVVTNRPTADTSLFQHDPDNNFGVGDLVSGTTGGQTKSRALIKFDVSTNIPSGATITSVTLTLKVTKQPGSRYCNGGPAPSNFKLYRVLQAWGEGRKSAAQNGARATVNEADWRFRFATNAPWSVPGAAAPVDFSPVASGTKLIDTQSSYTFSSTTNMVADVQYWLQNPTNNFGWIMISTSENTACTAKRFGSRDAGRLAPLLVVTYTPPPLITGLQVATNQISFGFVAEPQKSYAVQFVDSLSVTNWQILTNFGAQTLGTNYVVTDPIASRQRFYRVIAP